MLCRVNRIRQAHGLYPVVYHHQLMTLAQKHARFQSTYRVVTHADDAGQIGDRLSALGFQWGLVVENVGAGINDDDGISDAWENSSGHLANILHPDVRYMGVDVSRGYWVQDFASPLYKNYVVPLSSIDPCPIGRVLNIYN
ncbi:hypothetical protein GGI07_003986 [Coemansia sp. Benny D115]|nr:hypothetical protein GGI07_003986 [Coemansia sp. Benny D115]